jgi:hypothetical protein
MRSFANQLRWPARVGLLVVFLTISTGALQRNTQPGRRGPFTGADEDPPDIAKIEMERKQMKMLNEQRQKHLVSDTDKLLKLAEELRTDVNKTSVSGASSDAAHKANEIEKLARGIRSKMIIAP